MNFIESPAKCNDFYCFHRINQSRDWKLLPKFPAGPLDKCSGFALVSVDTKLYAAGGQYYGDFHDYIDINGLSPIFSGYTFHCFDLKDNEWRALPQMSACRYGTTFHLIHLDGFIYAIGGETGNIEYPEEEVERYDINQKKWETLSSLPKGIHTISAVLFKGSILVYGEKDKSNFNRESLQMMVYRPEQDEWQVTHRPTDIADKTDPLLFCYNDQCYQVNYIRRQPACAPIDRPSFCYPEILSVKAGTAR